MAARYDEKLLRLLVPRRSCSCRKDSMENNRVGLSQNKPSHSGVAMVLFFRVGYHHLGHLANGEAFFTQSESLHNQTSLFSRTLHAVLLFSLSSCMASEADVRARPLPDEVCLELCHWTLPLPALELFPWPTSLALHNFLAASYTSFTVWATLPVGILFPTCLGWAGLVYYQTEMCAS